MELSKASNTLLAFCMSYSYIENVFYKLMSEMRYSCVAKEKYFSLTFVTTHTQCFAFQILHAIMSVWFIDYQMTARKLVKENGRNPGFL